jgi:hypothetical protein
MEKQNTENVSKEPKESRELNKLAIGGFVCLGAAVAAAAVWGIKWVAGYAELSSIELIED